MVVDKNFWDNLNNGEKEEILDYMVTNYSLDSALRNLNYDRENIDVLLDAMEVMAKSIKTYRGLILLLRESNLQCLNNRLDLITDITEGEVGCLQEDDGDKFACVFTTKETFSRYKTKHYGGVIKINDLLDFIIHEDEVDGIVVNPGEDDMILDKSILAGFVVALGSILQNKEDKNK